MSIFDFPRINFTGIITLNPGTANNDDYSGGYTWPATGDNLALIDSAQVQPLTFGMSDVDFLAWIQKAQTFDITGKPGKTQAIIPAEWNYYGDMSSSVQATVVGVQTGPQTLYTTAIDGAPLSDLIGEKVELTGNITDINSEGSPPGTQFFLNEVNWKKGEFEISGTPNKASGLWINFTRNVNLAGDAGGGCYMYHAITGGRVALPGFDDPNIVGAILRYYVFARHGSVSSNELIEALYKNKQTNPAELQITGSFAPLYSSEKFVSTPVGRLLTRDEPNIPTPGPGNNAGGGPVALAPAVAHTDGDRISVDFLGSFPEYYQGGPQVPWAWDSAHNPKYDFGPVALEVRGAAGSAVVGPVRYADTDAGDERGWVFDFDVSTNADAQKVLADPEASFNLKSKYCGTVLAETEYNIVSNQAGIYAEQEAPGDSFVSQGLPREPMTISVFKRGLELSAAECPPVKVWGYRSIPLGSSGPRELIDSDYGPDRKLCVDTSKPGNYLFTFAVVEKDDPPSTGEPPPTYSDYISPPFMDLANRPAINLRVLPTQDFRQYWEDTPDGPVGNERLTFDVVYQNVLRTYYLLYPAMNAYVDLSHEGAVADAACHILERTDLYQWNQPGFMPITRDMSESRRTLLQAWCRKVNPNCNKGKGGKKRR